MLFGAEIDVIPIPAGTHQVRMEFSYDGGGLGKGGSLVDRRRNHPAGGANPTVRSAREA